MEQEEPMIDDNAATASPTRKRWAYVSARDVLPRELLAVVQEHYSGGFIYIPPPANSYYTERRKLVLALRLQGVPTDEIAGMASVTPRRVRQILAQARAKPKK
jgi:hypothetical protein